MLTQIFNLLFLLGLGVILVFIGALCLEFSIKKKNRKGREEAMKLQSSEPSDPVD